MVTSSSTSTSITPPAAAAEPHMCRPGQILIRLSLLLLLPCAQCFASTHGPGDGGVEGGGWRVGECCPVKAAAGPLVTLHPAEVTAGPAPAAARCGHRQCLCTLAERSNKLAYTAQHAPHYTLHMSMSQLSASVRTVASIHRATSRHRDQQHQHGHGVGGHVGH